VGKLQAVLWSVALPGFGQLLNGKYLKGILFIFLEFLINVQANFNEIILLSFNGEIEKAIQQTNYQWLMFYPCVYSFAIWDAFRDAGGGKCAFSAIPLATSAYSTTIGLMYSARLKLFGVLLGPIWLPILSFFIGLFIGYLILRTCIYIQQREHT
jgi:hypothetical protein